MTGAEILGSLLSLGGLLQGFSVSGSERGAAKTKAARALSEAVAATRDVIGKRANGGDDLDYRLTNLWHQASLAFRDSGDVDLSRLCQIKGNYWTQPSNWSEAQIHDAGIQLTRMQRELQRQLAGG